MSYKTELAKAMFWLGEQPNTLFIGQSVLYKGNAIFDTLKGVPDEKKIELPVIEDCQMGMSIGLSLAGKRPITIYPRMNFLMCAMNQLVNHLDKICEYSEYRPNVIVRVGVGSTSPLDPGVQHKGDYPIHLENVHIVRLEDKDQIVNAYQQAYYSYGSTMLIEYADKYGE